MFSLMRLRRSRPSTCSYQSVVPDLCDYNVRKLRCSLKSSTIMRTGLYHTREAFHRIPDRALTYPKHSARSRIRIGKQISGSEEFHRKRNGSLQILHICVILAIAPFQDPKVLLSCPVRTFVHSCAQYCFDNRREPEYLFIVYHFLI